MKNFNYATQPNEDDENALATNPIMPPNVQASAKQLASNFKQQTPASKIRQGLINRGMAPHIADAFVANAQDESGFDTASQEKNPLVKGSRGGFGLFQWTGPRRVALESYAAKQGKDPSDMDIQLDFLMTELSGPEANAYKKISATTTKEEAAASILNDFLRPAEAHRAQREKKYLKGISTTNGLAGSEAKSLKQSEDKPSWLPEAKPQPKIDPETKKLYDTLLLAASMQNLKLKPIEYDPFAVQTGFKSIRTTYKPENYVL